MPDPEDTAHVAPVGWVRTVTAYADPSLTGVLNAWVPAAVTHHTNISSLERTLSESVNPQNKELFYNTLGRFFWGGQQWNVFLVHFVLTNE